MVDFVRLLLECGGLREPGHLLTCGFYIRKQVRTYVGTYLFKSRQVYICLYLHIATDFLRNFSLEKAQKNQFNSQYLKKDKINPFPNLFCRISCDFYQSDRKRIDDFFQNVSTPMPWKWTHRAFTRSTKQFKCNKC